MRSYAISFYKIGSYAALIHFQPWFPAVIRYVQCSCGCSTYRKRYITNIHASESLLFLEQTIAIYATKGYGDGQLLLQFDWARTGLERSTVRKCLQLVQKTMTETKWVLEHHNNSNITGQCELRTSANYAHLHRVLFFTCSYFDRTTLKSLQQSCVIVIRKSLGDRCWCDNLDELLQVPRLIVNDIRLVVPRHCSKCKNYVSV